MHRHCDGDIAGLSLFKKLKQQYGKDKYLKVKKYIFCGSWNAKRYKDNAEELNVKITSSGAELVKYILKDLENGKL